MVCSCNPGRIINLKRIVITFNQENIEYEPEQVPRLVYRIGDIKAGERTVFTPPEEIGGFPGFSSGDQRAGDMELFHVVTNCGS